MSSNLGSSPRASVQRAEQTQTLNIHHSLSDKTRFVENSLPLVADSGNGDLKRALAELVQMGAPGALKNASAAADMRRFALLLL